MLIDQWFRHLGAFRESQERTAHSKRCGNRWVECIGPTPVLTDCCRSWGSDRPLMLVICTEQHESAHHSLIVIVAGSGSCSVVIPKNLICMLLCGGVGLRFIGTILLRPTVFLLVEGAWPPLTLAVRTDRVVVAKAAGGETDSFSGFIVLGAISFCRMTIRV